MLEERLSKAYSQQSLGGYSLPPPRQPLGLYPSMASQAAGGVGGAESYYTGHAAVGYQTPAAQPYGQPSQAAPQPPFSQYAPTAGPQPGQAAAPRRHGQGQGGDGWQTRQPPGPLDAHAQPQPQQPQQPQQPAVDSASRMQTPQQSSASPAAERRASDYLNTGHSAPSPSGPMTPGRAPDAGASPYPNLQQAMQYQPSPGSAPSQPTPMVPYAQPPQQPQPPQQQPQPQPPQPAQPSLQAQPHWQQQQQHVSHQPPAAPQGWAYAGYGQDAFPSVPQDEPVKKAAAAAEEALIEL